MTVDPTDLGLQLNIFEQLYNLDSGLQLDIDDTRFDPGTEAERARKLTGGVRPDRRRGRHPEVRQAPFAGFPRREQREWWQEYLQVAPANKHGNALVTNRKIQPWLLALLLVDWQASAADVVAQLRSHGPEGLFFRALAHRFSAAELAAARAQFSADWPELRTNKQGQEGYVVEEACIRAACGALPTGSARALFRGIPRNRIDLNAFRNPQAPSWDRVLLGLGLATPADRVHFATVTKHRFYNPSAVVPWLAGTGVAGLDLLAKWLTKDSADDCREMLREAARVAHGPGIAGFFLDALDSRGTEVAAEWLQSHPQALLHAELSSSQADKALQFLRGVELPDLDPDAPGTALLARLRSEHSTPLLRQTPDWWQTARTEILAKETSETKPEAATSSAAPQPQRSRPQRPRKLSLPFPLSSLPPLIIDGAQADSTLLAELLTTCQNHNPTPLITALKSHTTPANQDAFATGVLTAWLNTKAPVKTVWLLPTLAPLGGPDYTAHLSQLIHTWPKRGRHLLAAEGMRALAQVGTREAVFAVTQIALQPRESAASMRAEEVIAGLAAARGQTPTQIHDWALTTTPLTPQGHTHLTNGTHTYRATLQPDGHLTLHKLNPHHQPTGRPLTTIPPNKHNPTQTQTARTQLKNLRTQLTQHITLQNHHYHQAMLTSHRWHPHHFTQHIATHPLTRIIYPGLIWGIWQNNQLQTTAHIDPDGQLTDINDTPIHLTPTHQIDIIHPIDLTPTQTQNWLTHLTDYELTNPLNQLTQPTHHYQHPQQLTPTLPDLDLHTGFESVARARSWQWAQFGGDHQLAWLYLAELDLSLQVCLDVATRTAQATAHRGRLTWEVLRDRQLREMLQDSEARDVKLRDFPPELPWDEVPRRLVSEVLTFLAELGKA